jgi:hypothetical protein
MAALTAPAMPTEEAALDYAGPTILGNSQLAAKTFASWLPAPVESVLYVAGRSRTWVHHELAPRLTREQIAVNAVRAALAEATVPFGHTRTAPHPRQVYDIALAAGVELTRDEINTALCEVMAS